MFQLKNQNILDDRLIGGEEGGAKNEKAICLLCAKHRKYFIPETISAAPKLLFSYIQKDLVLLMHSSSDLVRFSSKVCWRNMANVYASINSTVCKLKVMFFHGEIPFPAFTKYGPIWEICLPRIFSEGWGLKHLNKSTVHL